jgi:hypothetical protein
MLEVTKARVRVPALSGPLNTSAIQFRGIGAAKPAAEDDGDEDMDEGDEDASKAESSPEDGKSEPKKREKKAGKAKKSKKAANDEDDDPDDDDDDDDNDEESDRREMRQTSPARAARLNERARIAAIVESPGAAANLEFALSLALTTDLTRGQAIALLEKAPKAGSSSTLAGRMAGYAGRGPGAGAPPQPKGQAAIDALLDQTAQAAGLMPRRG